MRMMPKKSWVHCTRSIRCRACRCRWRAEVVQPAVDLGQEPGLGELQQDGAEDHAPDAAHAAEDDHDQEHGGDGEVEHLGRGGLQLGDEEHARHAGEGGADGEGQQLEAGGVDAHGAGGGLVLADGHPGAADAAVAQAGGDEDEQGDQGEADVVVGGGVDAEVVGEDARGLDAVEACSAVGDAVEVAGDDGDDLAESEGDDGEVVAAEAQRGGAEQDAEEGADEGGGGEGEPEGEGEVDEVRAALVELFHEAEGRRRAPRRGTRRA